jgi:hypothetical protein
MRLALLLGLVLIPAAVLAANAGDRQDKKHDGLICREVEETGSRLGGRRVCMSREAWEASHRAARETISEAQMRQTNPCGSSQLTC